MPGLFSRLKGKDGGRSKKKNAINDVADNIPQKPQWDDAWTRKTVEPEEIHDLIRCCTEELKARGMFSSNAARRGCETRTLRCEPFLADVLRYRAGTDAVLQLLTFLSFYCPSVRLPTRAV